MIYLDTNIRKYIINNLKDCSNEEIKETIVSSTSSNDEVVLPGLGVLFEMVWNHNNKEEQENIIKIISESVKKA